VTLIRHDDNFELTTACQHRIHSSRGLLMAAISNAPYVSAVCVQTSAS
jgi:hypothetical protein